VTVVFDPFCAISTASPQIRYCGYSRPLAFIDIPLSEDLLGQINRSHLTEINTFEVSFGAQRKNHAT
jgi:hypothetical protein